MMLRTQLLAWVTAAWLIWLAVSSWAYTSRELDRLMRERP